VRVSADFSALRQTRWYEYVLRFCLGGLLSVVAGLIAERFGPDVGGLFLAFPVIFPASATLVEKHEAQKKRHVGIASTARGRQAAGLDAAGTALGAVALVCFACVLWRNIAVRSAPGVIAAAGLVWIVVATSLWWVRKRGWPRIRGSRHAYSKGA